jgi:hypothetical protein
MAVQADTTDKKHPGWQSNDCVFMLLSCSGSSSAVSVPLADPLPVPGPSCSLDLESPESSAATVHNFEVRHAGEVKG